MPRMISMQLYMEFLQEWGRDSKGDKLDDVDCRCLTCQAEYYISHGNLHEAIQSLMAAVQVSTRPTSVVFLTDAITFLEEAARAQTDEALVAEYLMSAKQSIARFKTPDVISQKLGRISLPIFEKPIERQIFRLFKTFGTMTYADLTEQLKLSKSSIKRLLEPLIERGVIIRADTEKGQPAIFYISK